MKSISIDERAIELAQYIIDSKDTVRGAAERHIRGGMATKLKYSHLKES